MNDESLTEWDSSKATLYRIDAILKACAGAAFQKDLVSWLRNLEVLKREAMVKMDEPKRKECLAKFDKLHRNIEMYTKARVRTGVESNLMNQLDDAEFFLRDFMNKKGMLLRDGKAGIDRFRGG